MACDLPILVTSSFVLVRIEVNMVSKFALQYCSTKSWPKRYTTTQANNEKTYLRWNAANHVVTKLVFFYFILKNRKDGFKSYPNNLFRKGIPVQNRHSEFDANG